MVDAEACEEDIPLRYKLDCIKGLVIADVRELPAGIINMEETFPRSGSFAATL